MAVVTIHFEPHPVSPERKAELRAKGLTIIDAIYAPRENIAAVAEDPLDHDGDGRKGGSTKPDDDAGDLAWLRAEYAETVGKRPFNGWDAATLRKKINEV